MDGILLFNKPLQWTSHDAVDFLRRRLNQKKIGHAGTLDPLATGLLVMLLGSTTKKSQELTGLDKDYRGTIRLGFVTDTWDLEGKILDEQTTSHCTSEMVEAQLLLMQGSQWITPPIYSALKKEGKRYYQLAREGVLVEPPAREVMIEKFYMERFENPEIHFFLSCSKGTYVRSLAYELGKKLGCGACLSSLIRTRIGSFQLEQALTDEQVRHFSDEQITQQLIAV